MHRWQAYDLSHHRPVDTAGLAHCELFWRHSPAACALHAHTMPLARIREQSDCRLASSAHSTPKERAVPTQTRMGSDRADLPPTRAAALRKWLQVANTRLLLLEHHRQQLLALATTLAEALGQRSSRPMQKRGKLAARLARAG